MSLAQHNAALSRPGTLSELQATLPDERGYIGRCPVAWRRLFIRWAERALEVRPLEVKSVENWPDINHTAEPTWGTYISAFPYPHLSFTLPRELNRVLIQNGHLARDKFSRLGSPISHQKLTITLRCYEI